MTCLGKNQNVRKNLIKLIETLAICIFLLFCSFNFFSFFFLHCVLKQPRSQSFFMLTFHVSIACSSHFLFQKNSNTQFYAILQPWTYNPIYCY